MPEKKKEKGKAPETKEEKKKTAEKAAPEAPVAPAVPAEEEKVEEKVEEKKKEKKKVEKKKKKEKSIYRLYKIENDKLTRLQPFCERCGQGYFMADHGNRYTCGHCGFTKYKHMTTNA